MQESLFDYQHFHEVTVLVVDRRHPFLLLAKVGQKLLEGDEFGLERPVKRRDRRPFAVFQVRAVVHELVDVDIAQRLADHPVDSVVLRQLACWFVHSLV